MSKNNIFTDWTEEDARRHNERVRGSAALPPPASEPEPRHATLPGKGDKASQGKGGGRQPNKTESEYRRLLELEFKGCEIVYEGLTFLMLNGHRYTPDWIVKTPAGWMLCVEVKARGKNGFRLPSYQRAKLAFDQARIEWNHFKWRFAEKHSGTWNISGFPLCK